MTSGGQCVMTAGTVSMPLWSASSWDMHTLKVSAITDSGWSDILVFPSPLLRPEGGIAYGNAYFGAGTGSIYLTNVGCTSSASQLLECSSSPILTHNCLHSADAGVECEGDET